MCGIKIEIFACLIAHQLQCFACRLLFGFLLAASAAFADDIAVEVHLYGEVLVMVGAMLAGEDVFEPFTGVLLNDLLQHRFVVFKRAFACRLRRRFNLVQYKALGFLQAAGIEIDRRRNGFEHVR